MKIYLLIALRRLYREKLYAFISVISLSIAMAAVIIVGSYTHFELSFDRHHQDYQRIYRVLTHNNKLDADISVHTETPPNWGKLFTQDYPDVGVHVEFAKFTRLAHFQHQDQARSWFNAYYVNAAAFDVFQHDILYGDPKTVFDHPDSMAISERFSRYYFGDNNPIGKQLLQDEVPFTVALVFKDLPETSHLRYDLLLPHSARPEENTLTIDNGKAINFKAFNATHYLKIKPNFDITLFEKLSADFVRRYSEESDLDQPSIGFSLQAIARIRLLDTHVHSDYNTAYLAQLLGVGAIGLLIIIVGCINTINLNTARATRTLTSLSMQHWLGANRGVLITQSLCESMVLAFIALVLGIGLVEVSTNLNIHQLLGGPGTFLNWKTSPGFTLFLLFTCVGIAFLSAIYPAWQVARLSTKQRINHRHKNAGAWARTILVSLQLVLAVSSITGVLLLLNQIRFIGEKELGFQLDNRLAIFLRGPNTAAVAKRVQNELAALPEVVSVTHSSWTPSSGFVIEMGIKVSGQDDPQAYQFVDVLAADEHFFDVLGIKIVEASEPNRNQLANQSQGVFVNQAFVENMSWDRQKGGTPLGQIIDIGGGDFDLPIEGIFQNFHSKSLHELFTPQIVIPINISHPLAENLRDGSPLIMHYNPQNEPALLEVLTRTIEKHNPGYPVNFDFLSDNWKRLYNNDEKLFARLLLFSGLVIALALMGLFGLAAYSAQARQREISIRKTIGASTLNNLVLMGKGVLIIAIVASLPAWIGVHELYSLWLDRFAYKVEFAPWLLVWASLMVIVLSQATVLSQSWRASQRNPAESLRYE